VTKRTLVQTEEALDNFFIDNHGLTLEQRNLSNMFYTNEKEIRKHLMNKTRNWEYILPTLARKWLRDNFSTIPSTDRRYLKNWDKFLELLPSLCDGSYWKK
jgi:hypothetical protein